MHAPLLESVPNVSVGREPHKVGELVAAIEAGMRAGAALDGSAAVLADVHVDADHDRTVFTLVGRGEALAVALEELARASVAAIDLHAGHGVHPRVGVLDIVPIIALEEGDAARDAAHALVERIAAFIGGGLEVPVVAYGLRRDGEPIEGAAFSGAARRGGPATVVERVASGELELLAGPRALHHTAGATIMGVRGVLVAFNVDLATERLDTVRAIAAAIRASAKTNDALPGVRALGFLLASRDIAQVSTNIERPTYVGPAKVLDTVVRLAREHDVEVVGAELVGLAPETTLAPLRYACTRLGVPLNAAPTASLEAAMAEVVSGAVEG